MSADPSLVRTDRLAGSSTVDHLDDAGRLSRSHPGIHFSQAYDAFAHGNLGDARAASSEAGARLVNTAVERIASFLHGLIDLADRKPLSLGRKHECRTGPTTLS